MVLAAWRHRAPDVLLGKPVMQREGYISSEEAFTRTLQSECIKERSWKHMNCLLCCCGMCIADAACWHCVDVLAADSDSNTHQKHLQCKEHQASSEKKEQPKCNLLREKREICQR